MTPDEVITRLQSSGVKISRSTLTRYENQGLIPTPKRGGGGPGGRYTDYPQGTVEAAAEANRLLQVCNVPQLLFLRVQDREDKRLLLKFVALGGNK